MKDKQADNHHIYELLWAMRKLEILNIKEHYKLYRNMLRKMYAS